MIIDKTIFWKLEKEKQVLFIENKHIIVIPKTTK